MLSIDEAIAHAREVANEQKRRSGICVQNNTLEVRTVKGEEQ